MSVIPYAVAVSAVAICSTWVVRVFLHRRVPLHELYESIEATRAVRLYPFVEVGIGFVDHDDNQLWRAMGHFSGLRNIFWEAGILFSVGLALAVECPLEAKDACREIIWSSIYLRIMALACILEALTIQMIPALPRIQARSVARLYCNIATGIDVLISSQA